MGERLAGLRHRLARLFRRLDLDRELDEERRFRLEKGEAAARAEGASAEDSWASSSETCCARCSAGSWSGSFFPCWPRGPWRVDLVRGRG